MILKEIENGKEKKVWLILDLTRGYHDMMKMITIHSLGVYMQC